MSEILHLLPLSFWAVIAVLAYGGFRAFHQFRDGTGLPMLAVMGTVTAWYVGDAFYNDYADNHYVLFSTAVLSGAWWQVAWFLLVFLLLVPLLHRYLNRSYLNRGSGAMQMFKHGVGKPAFQTQLNVMFYGCVALYAVLCALAVFMLKGQILYFFFPFLSYHANPWVHGRVGAGLDFILILALYLHLLVASIFGVVAALTTNRGVLAQALTCCLLAWPYFLFDRTRNTILAILIPGIIAFGFLRLRGGWVKKLVVLGGCYVLINAWMGFIIANRSHGSINQALKEGGFSMSQDENVHHEGLNMFEELCWINTFIRDGRYHPNWGARYFAEVVNPIPRVLWPGKPLIGIDYAKLRGQGRDDAEGAGVNATISTGMIGQGVVNFGRILGPAFAALLLGLWVAVLARLDLEMNKLGRLPIYCLGLIMTFNMGRDITLITLYPFVFGLLLLWWLDRQESQSPDERRQGRVRVAGQPGLMLKPTVSSGKNHNKPIHPQTGKMSGRAAPRQPARAGSGNMSSRLQWPQRTRRR